MPLVSGTKLGRYEIQSPLAAGGMGDVYRARDAQLGRVVALKVLPSHLSFHPDAKERFDREARVISSLSHPNICTLYDVGHQEGVDFLVLEYLEGETLAERLAKGALLPDQVLKYGIEICEGLETAHKKGVIHRDLKPGNIMLTKSGVKLMDFGLAKASLDMSPERLVGGPLTTEGTVGGTLQYMSPEQIEGKQTDPRSDIFALGVVLYEMATGKKPFDGKSSPIVIESILKSEPLPILALNPMMPLPLELLVSTCLEKDPDERWQAAHDVKLQLRNISEMRPEGRTSAATEPAGQRSVISHDKAIDSQELGPLGRNLVGIFLILLPALLIYFAFELFPGERAGGIYRSLGLFGKLVTINLSANAQIVLFVAIVAALGGYVSVAKSFTSQARAGALRRAWVWWYLLRTFTAAPLAVIFYFILRAVIFSSAASAESVNALGITTIAALIGLYADQAVDRLGDVFAHLFGPPPKMGEVEERISERVAALVVGPVLDNYRGFACVVVKGSEGRSVESDSEGVPLFFSGQPGTVYVWFEKHQPERGFCEPVNVRDGREAKVVTFEISLDSDTLHFDLARRTIEAPVGVTSERLTFGFVAPKQPGHHDIWVQIFQKNRLIQVVPSALKVKGEL